MKTITLDEKVIEAIAGHYDEALRMIEDRFRVRMSARGNDIKVLSEEEGGLDLCRDAAAELRREGLLETP